jgi:hypothetical protein
MSNILDAMLFKSAKRENRDSYGMWKNEVCMGIILWLMIIYVASGIILINCEWV